MFVVPWSRPSAVVRAPATITATISVGMPMASVEPIRVGRATPKGRMSRTRLANAHSKPIAIDPTAATAITGAATIAPTAGTPDGSLSTSLTSRPKPTWEATKSASPAVVPRSQPTGCTDGVAADALRGTRVAGSAVGDGRGVHDRPLVAVPVGVPARAQREDLGGGVVVEPHRVLGTQLEEHPAPVPAVDTDLVGSAGDRQPAVAGAGLDDRRS